MILTAYTIVTAVLAFWAKSRLRPSNPLLKSGPVNSESAEEGRLVAASPASVALPGVMALMLSATLGGLYPFAVIPDEK